jgi:acetoin utilization deacetylase AcuC-like enzyme
VLYWSLHQKDGFPLKGDVDEIGTGKGVGYTVNVPLPAHAGDDAYMQAVETLAPVALQFKPDIVAVSAGFDAHGSDTLLQLDLSANTFYKLGVWLRKNFSNIFATLEGGYNLETFPSCFYNFLDGVNGKEQRFKESSTESTIQVLDQVTLDLDRLSTNLSKFWKL